MQQLNWIILNLSFSLFIITVTVTVTVTIFVPIHGPQSLPIYNAS